MNLSSDRSTEVKKKKRRRIFYGVIAVVTIVVLSAAYARYVEPHILLQRETEYTSAKLVSAPGEELTAAVFADTHFSDYYTPKDFQKVVEKVNAQKPDLIFFLGDLIDDYSSYTGDIEEIERQLASLKAGIGKYAVYGNHDYGGKMQFDYPDVMEAGGFQLLINESQTLEAQNITITGIDDMVIGYGEPAAAGTIDAAHYNIVLCHEPDVIDEMTGYPVDLMLSGHTHGRQINLMFFDDYILPPYGKKYVRGGYEILRTDGRQASLYVTAGIGTTKIPMRFASPPEINIVKLKGR